MDTMSYELGSEDAKIIQEAVKFRRWWLFAGGAFHFSISDLPLTTVMALAVMRHGTIVPEAPEVLKFKAAVSPIGMANSAVFTLSSVLERLAKLHEDMQGAGIPPHQLQELLPLGSAIDLEYMLGADELLRLAEDVVDRKDTVRSDSMLSDLVCELIDRAGDVYPDIFLKAKELFYA